MLRIPGADGKFYRVVSWTTFKAWIFRFGIAYVILAVAASIGIWAFTNRANGQIIDKINQFATAVCPENIKGINKHNDLVQNVIDVRNADLADALSKHDTSRAKIDRAAIARYSKDFITPPTKKQCQTPILKG